MRFQIRFSAEVKERGFQLWIHWYALLMIPVND